MSSSARLNSQNRPSRWASAEVGAANSTISLLTPNTGKRFILESLSIANFGTYPGTIAFYFGDANDDLAPTRIGIFSVATSTTINPWFPALDNNTNDEVIRVSASQPSMSVAAYGFELDD